MQHAQNNGGQQGTTFLCMKPITKLNQAEIIAYNTSFVGGGGRQLPFPAK